MKKKSVLFTTALLFVFIFSNTGYAKAVKKKIEVTFGAYIVQLSGKNQTTETLYYNSKVYIPINDVSKLTSATVKKKGNTYNITPVKKEDGIDQVDINTIKFYSEMQNLYASLELLGDNFFRVSNSLSLAYNEISHTGKTDYLNSSVLDNFNSNINYYNDYIDIVESKISRAKDLKLFNQKDQNNFYEILNLLLDSIDSYKLAIDDLNKLAISNSDYDFGKYHANAQNAYESALEAQKIASNGYNSYYEAIQNHK
jgi:hypothetical protein